MLVYIKHFLRHYFTPHHTNNYRAKTLHLTYFVAYLILLYIAQTGSNYMKYAFPDILGYATDISAEKVLELVNSERAKYDLSPLAFSSNLATAATAKAADMFKSNYWAHVSPTGVTPWEFITGSGYKYVYAGENLAKNFDSSAEVVNAWMNSPTHRANILKPEYKELGIAVMNGKLQGDDTTLVVEEFGARSTPIAALPPRETVREQSSPENNAPQTIPREFPQQQVISAIAPIHLNKRFSLYIAEFLLIILCIDALYMWRFKTSRVSGHTLAHIIFITALIGAMGATGIGVIL